MVCCASAILDLLWLTSWHGSAVRCGFGILVTASSRFVALVSVRVWMRKKRKD